MILKTQRFLFFIALIVGVLFFSSSKLKADDSSTLKYAFGAEPDTLNPILATDAYAARIESFFNDNLIDRDHKTLKLKPSLATHWEISEDRLEYTFYLRHDVYWHDGKKFTADDVVYSFNQIQNPKVTAPHLRGNFLGAGIKKIKKIDDYTVKFISERPYFRALETCGSLPLVPKHIYQGSTEFNFHPNNRKPIGLGPYQFKKWKTGRYLVLERNENYWDTKPKIKKILFKIITDQTMTLNALKKGEVDVTSVRPIQWVWQTSKPKFKKDFYRFRYLSPGYSYIAWNQKKSFFGDKRVRLAMTHLVDRKKILEKINFGLGKVVSGPFFMKSDQYNQNIKPHPYDPKKARQILKKAGFRDTDGNGIIDKDGRDFVFTFIYTADSKTTERIVSILKQDLKKVGIEMKVRRMEWSVFLTQIIEKKFDAASLGWSMSIENDPYQVWHSNSAKGRGHNFVSFINPKADELIEKARVEFDPIKRNAFYHEFHQILHEEQPYTFLFARDSLVSVSKRFKNIHLYPLGLEILEWIPQNAKLHH